MMNPLFIVEQCYNNLPQGMKAKPWEMTEHGKKVLQTEDELNAYIAAYGEMHIIKCRAALQNFPFENFNLHSFEIFDWGCGQGLATLTLLDMLHERNMLSHLTCIYLIEPSICALNRATTWVKQNAGPGIQVISINTFIPQDINASMPEVHCDSRISINLFSNILDIKTVNLAWLANKTAALAPINYMICVGPRFTQDLNTRLSDFCGYFGPTEYFSNISVFPYSYTTRTHHAYGCETKCFVHNRNKTLHLDYTECANNESIPDPYDYTTEILSGIVDENIVTLYNNLRYSCSTSYDIFFRPIINCDTVDFVLTSTSKGIILINICENLNDIDLIFSQVETVKNDLFNIHLRSIKIDSIVSSNIYNCVKTALYFPNHPRPEIDRKIKELNQRRNEKLSEGKEECQKDYYRYLHILTRESNLKENLEKISASGFKYAYYDELIKLISSAWHSYKDGDLNFRLSPRQKDIVRNESKRIRVKGVAGCGKTQVVAYRAVEQHLKTGDRVLIITFNISLIQYIRMRIQQVPADFSPNMFEVINYHQFFKSKASQYSLRKINIQDFDDESFFNPYREKIQKYKSIIIDEVQDFKEPWLRSIITNFLADNGSVSLFGDGEQNIYDRELEEDTKMPPIQGCGFVGRWNEMSERISLRIQNPNIALLSSNFAHTFMSHSAPINIQNSFLFEEYYIKYWMVDNTITADKLVSNIRWIISQYKLDIRDVAVLGQSISLLRAIEDAYVRATHQPTMISFETASQYNQIKKGWNLYIKKNLDEVRRAAKTHFTTVCDAIKISTIHSFKGWESKTIILLLQPKIQSDGVYDNYEITERENTPALIYTALTRARCNLFIININNPDYHLFFNNNIH